MLLVDDAVDIRTLVRLGLERDGRFEVVAEAGDGREAVDRAREHQPDLIVLDVAMPVMDGLEALPLIRATSPRSRVVMLSGFTAESMERGSLDQGADAYLEKGTPLPRIASALHEVARSDGHVERETALDGRALEPRQQQRQPDDAAQRDDHPHQRL